MVGLAAASFSAKAEMVHSGTKRNKSTEGGNNLNTFHGAIIQCRDIYSVKTEQ